MGELRAVDAKIFLKRNSKKIVDQEMLKKNIFVINFVPVSFALFHNTETAASD